MVVVLVVVVVVVVVLVVVVVVVVVAWGVFLFCWVCSRFSRLQMFIVSEILCTCFTILSNRSALCYSSLC